MCTRVDNKMHSLALYFPVVIDLLLYTTSTLSSTSRFIHIWPHANKYICKEWINIKFARVLDKDSLWIILLHNKSTSSIFSKVVEFLVENVFHNLDSVW